MIKWNTFLYLGKNDSISRKKRTKKSLFGDGAWGLGKCQLARRSHLLRFLMQAQEKLFVIKFLMFCKIFSLGKYVGSFVHKFVSGNFSPFVTSFHIISTPPFLSRIMRKIKHFIGIICFQFCC